MKKQLLTTTALAGLIFMLPGGAFAACLPSPPNSGDNITCTGADNTGLNNPAADGVGVTVDVGATINVPGGSAIHLGNASSVNNNNGNINGGAGDGVAMGDDSFVTNLGTIVGSDEGIQMGANGFVQVTSGGTVTGDTGIFLTGGAATITVYGAITGTGGTAIDMLGTTNSTFTMGSNAVINGTVDAAAGGTDNFRFDATNNVAFNTTRFTDKFLGFDTFDKDGGSNLTLTGSTAQDWNIHGGELIVNVNSIANANIDLGAALNFDSGGTYAGDATGAGDLIHSGAGTLVLTGNNAYTGETTVVGGGTLSIADTGAMSGGGDVNLDNDSTFQFGSAYSLNNNFNIGNNDATIDTQAFATAISGTISGATGTITKQGSGALTLTGNNSYEGLVIDGGTIIGDTNSIVGTSAVLNTGTLQFDQAGAGTYSADISGLGTFVKNGVGNLTLSGTNTYSGGTNVNAGTLTGSTTSLQGNITNSGATVVFDQAGNGTYGGDIDGTGTVIKSGNGEVAFNGDNSNFTGDLQINGGTLIANSADALGAENTGTDITISNATLGTSASFTSNHNILINGGNATFDTDVNDNTFGGVISGAGNIVKVGAGSMTLAGANTYVGDLLINEGAVIVNADTGFGDIANTIIIGDGTLQMGAAFTLARDITLNDVNSSIDTGGFDIEISGDIDGVGRIVKDGAGSLTLTGTNTFSGGIAIEGGSLIGTTASITSDVTNNALLVFDQAGPGTFGFNVSGTGGVEFDGGATYTLTGANTYTGGTTVNAGTAVTGDLDAIFGDYANNGAVTITGASGTYAGDMSGAGELTIDSAGNTITLSGTNTFTGGTTVTATTTLQGTTDSLQGAIDNSGTVAYNQAGAGTTNASVSGTGGVSFAGGGDYTLTGASSYTGGTSIAAATSVTGDSDSIFGDYTNDGTLTFDQTVDGTYAGDITGTGALVKDGAEDLILTGTGHTYSGGTTISDGRLIGTTNTIQGDIINNAILRYDQGINGTIAGDISGTGSLDLDGTSDYLLTGTNTYTGGTTVNVGNSVTGDTDAVQGDYINGGQVTINGASGTYAGDMSGAGDLILGTTGTITLSGTLTHTGGTTVNNGTTAQGTTNSLQGTINNSGTVAFDQAGAGSTNASINGTGDVSFSGGGDYTLTGTNTYTGGTSVAAATSVAGDTDALQGDITNDGIVEFTGTDSTYADDMTGTGVLNVNMATANTGLTLTGTGNAYSGGTHILQGYLIGTTDAIQGDVIVDATGTLAIDQNTDDTFAGDISGAGAFVKSGTGNVTLSGTNTYAGGNAIIAGTLTGTTDSIIGNVNNAGTLVFDQVLNGSFAGNITGPGAFTKEGAGNVTLTGTNAYSGLTTISDGTLTGTTASINNGAAFNILNNASLVFDQAGAGLFDSNISGTGDVLFDGGGTYTVRGNNTYSGGTEVTSGTSVSGDFDALQGDILNDGDVTFTSAANATYADDMSGTGVLNIAAANRIIDLTGTNTYTGGTTVTASTTVRGDTDALVGDYDNDGIVVFNQAADDAYAGDMQGTGALVKIGAGNLTLTGANTYTGNTEILIGTLSLDTTGSIAAASDIIIDDDATLAFLDNFTIGNDISLTGTGGIIDTDGNDVTLNGDISGTRLTKNGSGTLTLDGTNTYTNMEILTGTVVGTTDSIVGDILNEASLTFVNTIDGAFNGDISGTGDVTFNSANQFDVFGTNTYSGGTFLTGNAQVMGNVLSLQGAIDIDTGSLLSFDQTVDGTYAGTLTGDGDFRKVGGGNLRLTGNSAGYTGDMQIGDGILSVNANYGNSAVFVNNGGTLGGNGTTGTITVASGGILAPGNSIDTLNVTGDVIFDPGSEYRVEFDSTPNNSDKIIATGDIIINGGSVVSIGSGSSFSASNLYTILSGANVTGTFDGGISTNLAFLDPFLIYNASNVQMRMDRNDILFQDIAEDEYQAQVADALTSSGTNDLTDAFTGLTAEEARAALDDLSGEHNAGVATAAINSTTMVTSAIARHMAMIGHASNENMLVASLAPNPDPGTYTAAYFEPTEDDPNWDNANVWMQMVGGFGRADARRFTPEQDHHSYGAIAGVDLPMDHGGWYGFFGGYEAGDVETDSQGASSDMNNYHVGTYITKPWKHGINIAGAINATYHDIETDRNIVMPGFDANPKGETEGATVAAYAEISKPYKVLDAAVEPYAAVSVTHSRINGYTEKEGGSANLEVGEATATNPSTTIGVRMGRMVYMEGLAFKVNASVGWQHVFGDIESTTTNRFAMGSSSFVAQGTPRDRDSAVIGFGIDGKIGERSNVYLNYNGILSTESEDHALTAGVKVKF